MTGSGEWGRTLANFHNCKIQREAKKTSRKVRPALLTGAFQGQTWILAPQTV
jgi:hypothetical protein